MAGWISKLSVVLVTSGVLGGCGGPLEETGLEVSPGELSSVSQAETESLQAACTPIATNTQRMQSELPPAEGAPPRSIPSPDTFVDVGGQLYFLALGEGPGQTLWRSNGTPAGTVAVKDFSTELRSPTAFSSRLFFVTEEAARGEELWVSDGTSSGTQVLKDVTPGAASSSLVSLTALDKRLVFFRQVRASNRSLASELWTSDGTSSGTVRVVSSLPEVVPPPSRNWFSGPVPADVLNLGSVLLFVTREASGPVLWRTDGTRFGTQRLKDVGAAGTGVSSTRVSGGQAFFYVKGTDGTTAVWKSDGTKAGTQRLYTYDATLSPLLLGALGSSLYVTTTSTATQRIVLRRIPLTGGCESPVFTLPNEYADLGSAYPHITGISAAAGGKKVYFAVTIDGERQAPRDAQLWGTDGTAAGTRLLHRPLSRSDEYTSPLYAAADNLVFFSADGGSTQGIEPWVTDGTPGGARLLKDLTPGSNSSYPYGFLRAGPRVFLSTADIIDGGQVWATNVRILCSAPSAP